ncbi:hypothetical protein TM48_03441 [Mycobacterium shottsii]|uniref:DUF2314 domain-containing protein n=1 Tax=Mycobacterium shottsii TaxID=133549 RepID=A0A7I7LHX6_9MYCO|nr:DUF2314 domain-containing protein [Mycobacterium shottsii]QYL29027.1 hypothetical protein TM48_03441 [Mycobacterium shottsii]BBX59197.1 hypothetical protein MSHO_45420 [Mycobacterium shottsii]
MSPNPFQQGQDVTDLIPAVPLLDGGIAFTFAIYDLPMPAADPFDTLDELLANISAGFHQVESISGDETEPTVCAFVNIDPRNDYPPTDPEFVELFNYGVGPQLAIALQSTQAAFILNFSCPIEQARDCLRAAQQLTGSLAAATGGLIWDAETRQIFTPAAWQEIRVDRWTRPTPDVDDHTIIHAYEINGQMRVVTLGMAKFGLPDVVVNQVPRSVCSNVGQLVSAFCQAIADRPLVERPGEFDLDYRRLRPNATGAAPLTVRMGEHHDGDPVNRLLEITFDRGPGQDAPARRHAILCAAFDSGASIVPATHNDALAAASRSARAKLPALRAAFNEGLPPGEFMQVKAHFEGPDGTREYMWVDVVTWNGDEITGPLANKPFNIAGLHPGQVVVVAQSTVFDYKHKRSDGTIDGNETEKHIISTLN